MTLTHDDYLDLAARAALESLPPTEEAALRAYMATNVAARQAFDDFATAAGALAWGAPDMAPPADLKARMFERLLAEATEPKAEPIPFVPPRLTLIHDATRDKQTPRDVARSAFAGWRAAAVGTTAGLLASLLLNVYFWGHIGELGGQLAVLQTHKQETETKLAGMQQQSETRAAQIAVLQARDTRMAKLPGQPGTMEASAMLFWSPTEQAWLVAASGLPPTEAGKTYQLWAVTAKGEKISMGTFAADATGAATVRLAMPKPNMKAAAAAVSLEPAGGVLQPTGPIVVMGELKI